MTEQTNGLNNLMDKQKELMKNVENMTPVLDKMEGMISKMGGMDKIMSYLGQGKQ
jgi:hypothetical protein